MAPDHTRGDKTGRPTAQEPIWLVRIVLVLFLIGFASFLAREVQRITG